MAGVLRDLGPCSITYNSVVLGETFGDVVARYKMESKSIKEDSKGVAEVDAILVGATLEIEVPLSRTTLAQLQKVIPGSTISAAKLDVNSPVGISLYDIAAILILKPIVAGVAGPNTTWITVAKAAPMVDLEIVYNNEGQRVFKVLFKCFADSTTGKIFQVGA
jgi:hypothetical protein